MLEAKYKSGKTPSDAKEWLEAVLFDRYLTSKLVYNAFSEET